MHAYDMHRYILRRFSMLGPLGIKNLLHLYLTTVQHSLELERDRDFRALIKLS